METERLQGRYALHLECGTRIIRNPRTTELTEDQSPNLALDEIVEAKLVSRQRSAEGPCLPSLTSRLESSPGRPAESPYRPRGDGPGKWRPMGGPDGPSMATSEMVVVDACGCSAAADGCRSPPLPGLSIRLEKLGADARPAS